MPFAFEFTVNASEPATSTNFHTIQAAVDAAGADTRITVEPGVYLENIVINTSGITLVSAEGREATTITGTQNGSAFGTIVVSSGVNNVTIGGPGAGFTIEGIDGPNASTEAAAINLRGSHSGITISGNDIEANGDAALRSANATIQNITVDGNIFSGTTFDGTADAPRGLVTLGANAGNSANITFTNNEITGTAGGLNAGNVPTGANLVTIDAQNSNISDNVFSGYTTGAGTQLRVREEFTDITENTFTSPGGGNLGITVQLTLFEPAGTIDENTYIYGSGNDQITLRAEDENVDGGAGVDTLVLTSSFFSPTNVVDLSSGFVMSNASGFDEVSNIENVVGSNQRDVIIGSDGDNVITASGGEDIIDGRGGSDTFNASNTNGAITADLGDDGYVSGPFTADLTNVENIRTGGGADTVYTSDADNTVTTGNGADTVYASGGDDDYDLGAGSDQVIFAGARDGYTITWDGTDAIVTETATGDTTTVSDAGILQFADSKVILVDDASAEFSTIQSAVDAASDGDEIIVADGTYVEQVVIDGFSDLTLTASEGAVLQAPADVVETVRSASDGELHGVLTVIDSTNVVIDGLTVDGDGRAATVDENGGVGQANFAGVVFRNASGGLEDVTITGIRDAYPGGLTEDGFPVVSGAQRGVGLMVDNDSLLTFFMHGGEISDFQKNATRISGADLDVTGVTITGGGAQPIIAQNGIQVLNSTGTIDGNTITDIGYAGPAPAYSGIILAYGNTDLNITNNVLTGANEADAAAKVVGIFVLQFPAPNTGGSITGNTISFVDEGIDVSGDLTPDSILIEDNTVTDIDMTDPYAAGVYFAPTPGLDVDHDVEGTDAADVLIGGAGDDQFDGLGGADVITGNGGDDALFGGGGDDTITGGDGDDDQSGGAGDDTFVYTASGEMAANESVVGGEGADTVLFSSTTGGTLTLGTGVSVETVQISTDGALNDVEMNIDASAVTGGLTINGNDANNSITGSEEADMINGGAGDDLLNSGAGDDMVDGGDGVDTLIVEGEATFNVVNGGWEVETAGDGVDTLTNVEIVTDGDGSGATYLLVGAGGFATIQDALDAAGPGDTILLAPGEYDGNFTVSVEGLTIKGIGAPGSVVILGTFEADNAITGDVTTFLETASGYSSASGTGITIAADGVTLDNITIDGFATGIDIGDGTDALTVSGVDITNGVYGINKGAAADANDVVIDGSSLEDLYIGIIYQKAVGADGRADGLTITDTDFTNLGEKGIYLETGSNVLISDITMDDVGQFGRGPAFDIPARVGEFGNGIDINLKYDDGTPYSNIVIEDFTFTDVGASAGVDSVVADFGGAIVVKARDDAGSYNVNSASFDGAIVIRDGTIDGTSTGIRAGEPGKNITSPAVTVENVVITDASVAEADNVTQSTMTVTLTEGADDFGFAPTTTGDVVISGAGGNDTIQTGAGSDELIGGAGDDVLIGGAGADILNGGLGSDTASYVGSVNGVGVNLTLSTATGGDAQGDTLANIENLTGSGANDTLTGDEEANILVGGAGDDSLTGQDGDDTVQHDAGNDSIDGGAGTDAVTFDNPWTDYTITRDGNTYTVTGFGFTDTVTDVETFVFDGVEIDVTADPDVIVTAFAPEVVSVEEGGIDEDEDADTIEVDEGSAEDTVVATVTADDINLPAGDSLTFSLVDADGNPFVGPFTINQTSATTAEIVVSGNLDFLTQSEHVLIVKITDSDGQSTTEEVTVTVLDVNDAPSDITFGDDTPSVDENAVGAQITTVLGSDQNAGDVLTYSVSDARFEIITQDGSFVLALKEGESLDHEAEDEVTVTVTVTDLEGETYDEDVTITVNDVNERPTDIAFGDDTPAVDENDAGAAITTLTGTDPDDGDNLTFDVSDDRFEVVQDAGIYTLKLRDGETLDHEAEDGSVTVTVSATDGDGENYDEDITITVNDVNEAPTDITTGDLTPSVAENAAGGVVTTLIVADEDDGDTFTFEIDDSRFEVVEEDGTYTLQLKDGQALDHETETSVDLEIEVSDADGETFTKTVTVTVTDVNEAPGNGAGLAVWSPDAVQAGLRRGVLFPEAVVTDPEGDILTYTLVTGPSAGKLYLGDVALVAGATLTEAEFAALTYGAPNRAGSFNASFTVSDGVNDTPLNIVLTVSPAVNDRVAGDVNANLLDGGAGADTIIGRDGADTLYGGSGKDAILGGTEADILYGGANADVLRGNTDHDQLYGQAGADVLVGGAGDDLVVGGGSKDTLRGQDGEDTLDGGAGRDEMKGGLGNDDFVFSAALGTADRILDFTSREDEIVLSRAVFGALGGSVGAGEFRLGTEAVDRNDHLIYNRETGELFYDADGSGGRDQILFARFEPDTILRLGDFDIIA